MSSVFLWAQVIGFVAMGINILSWQLKNPRHIILSYVPANTLWAIQYMMLGAPVGAMINLCSAAKDGGLAFVKDKYVPFLIGSFLCVVWIVGLHFFQAWHDLLPLIAGTILNLSLLQRNNRPLYARASLTACALWLVYNVIVGSWIGTLSACLVMTSSIIGMARHEEWALGQCYKKFTPNLARSLFAVPNFRTYP